MPTEQQKPARMPGLVLGRAYEFMSDYEKKNAGAKPSADVVMIGLLAEILLEIHDVALSQNDLISVVERASSPSVPVADVIAALVRGAEQKTDPSLGA